MASISAPWIMAVEVEDVVVPAPYLVAEALQLGNYECAVKHQRHGERVAERCQLSSASL